MAVAPSLLGHDRACPLLTRTPVCPLGTVLDGAMPLDGEYALSPTGWVRDQTERILADGTTDGVDIGGRPVILLTTRGARSGKLRKVPLMRVEHDGVYAIVASLGGAPKHRSGTSTSRPSRMSSFRTAR